MTFNTACNRRLPFVSPFTAPPDFFVTSRPELLRLFIVIAFFTPLSSNFRIKRCKIILSRNCQAASAVRATVSLATIAYARSPDMSFLACFMLYCHYWYIGEVLPFRNIIFVKNKRLVEHGVRPVSYSLQSLYSCKQDKQRVVFQPSAVATSLHSCPNSLILQGFVHFPG